MLSLSAKQHSGGLDIWLQMSLYTLCYLWYHNTWKHQSVLTLVFIQSWIFPAYLEESKQC